MVYVLVAVICALALFWLAVPLLDRKGAQLGGAALPRVDSGGDRRTELLDRRESLLRSLKELEFDRSMGKLEDAEYEAQRVDLAARITLVLDSLEAPSSLSVPVLPRPAGNVAPASFDAVLELEIAVQRYRNQSEIFSQ